MDSKRFERAAAALGFNLESAVDNALWRAAYLRQSHEPASRDWVAGFLTAYGRWPGWQELDQWEDRFRLAQKFWANEQPDWGPSPLEERLFRHKLNKSDKRRSRRAIRST